VTLADNIALGVQLSGLPVGTRVATDGATYSGDEALVQLMRLVHVEGAEGAKTVTELIRLINALAGSNHPGIPLLAVRRDSAATPADADGKYTTLAVDSSGRLYVIGNLTLSGALPAGTNNIGDVDVLTLPALPAGANHIGAVAIDAPVGAGGLTAHDAALSDNPITIGGYASSAAPSDVSANGDAVRAWFLRNGAQVINLAAAGVLIPGDAGNGLDVDVTRIQGTVTVTGDVAAPGSATIYDGTLAATTTAAALGASQAWREVLIQSDPDNTANVFVGNATSQSIKLLPGGSVTIPAANRNLVYAKAASGTQTVNYLGRS